MTIKQIEPETGTSERTIREDHVDITTCEEEPKKQTRVRRFPVIEIFGPVIQGEGSQAGNQTMFVRFGGCDYRCQNCDSLHAVIPEAIQKHATYMTADEILDVLLKDKTGVEWVTFTGGNPCMHKLDGLVEKITSSGFYINLETQGTLWQDWVNHCTQVTISPKTHGMGEKFEEEKYTDFLANLGEYTPVCIKVVVFAEVDLEQALRIQMLTEATLGSTNPYVSYYLSVGNSFPPILDKKFALTENPELVDGKRVLVNNLLSSYKRLSEEVLQDKRLKRWRFLPQIHVLMYGNESER